MESMEGLNGRRILVTGGAGFVGSHVIELLLSKKATVVVPIRSVDPQSYFFLQGLQHKIISVICDITDTKRMRDVVSKYQIGSIIHLAAQAIVTTAYINPEETLRTNILGTISVLEAARLSQSVRNIIIASSDKAYGKSKKEYTETTALCGDHPYEVSKTATDLISQMYQKTYNLPVIITRFGNIYGPGDQNFSRIIPGIITSMITNQPLHLRSDGTFVRDYVYVKDVALAYNFLLNNFESIPKEPYNIGSNDSLDVISLVNTAKRILNKKITYIVDNSQKNEIPYQHLNWQKMKTLGWRPRYTLAKGLKETYLWYKKYKNQLYFQ